jgi:hypothetical protein
MNDLRAAAQQALEFLDAEFGWSPGEAPRIDALRTALAQQEQEKQSVAEKFRAAFDAPPAPTPDQSAINWLKARPYIEAFIDGMGYDMTLTDERVRFEAREKVDVLAQQEPYCYIYEYDSAFGLHREFYPGPYNGKQKPDRTVPLYTHPPRREWQSLTEEEIRELTFHNQRTLWPRPDRSDVRATAIPFARAIEAALKERNT